jgi:hypothetical protein
MLRNTTNLENLIDQLTKEQLIKQPTAEELIDELTNEKNKADTIYSKRGPINPHYLKIIKSVLVCSIEAFQRIFAIRFDLHLPADFDEKDTAVISRFFASLNAQLESEKSKKTRYGIRAHSHQMNYLWCREIGQETKRPHFHVCLFLNGNAFHTLGSFKAREGNLFSRIITAWASALKSTFEDTTRLVHFPDRPTVMFGTNDNAYLTKLAGLIYRVSYFAKYDTKNINKKVRSFGSSRYR